MGRLHYIVASALAKQLVEAAIRAGVGEHTCETLYTKFGAPPPHRTEQILRPAYARAIVHALRPYALTVTLSKCQGKLTVIVAESTPVPVPDRRYIAIDTETWVMVFNRTGMPVHRAAIDAAVIRGDGVDDAAALTALAAELRRLAGAVEHAAYDMRAVPANNKE